MRRSVLLFHRTQVEGVELDLKPLAIGSLNALDIRRVPLRWDEETRLMSFVGGPLRVVTSVHEGGVPSGWDGVVSSNLKSRERRETGLWDLFLSRVGYVDMYDWNPPSSDLIIFFVLLKYTYYCL